MENNKIEFYLNDTGKLFNKLEKVFNNHDIVLEINLLLKENRNPFVKLQTGLQKIYPQVN